MTMLVELPSNRFDRAVPLFAPDGPNSTMIFSTLEGRTPGKAYVDVLEMPAACVLSIDYYHLTFLSHAAPLSWSQASLARLREIHDINLVWPTHLVPPLPPAAVIDRAEFFDLPIPEDISQCLLSLPEGFQFQSMTHELLARCLWRDEIRMACGTEEQFLRHGIGVCLLHEADICSEAYAVFRGADRFEIGVITNEAYRRRNLAYLTCLQLAVLCTEGGYPTYWSCHQDNAGSMETARKLGYRTQRAYKILHYPAQQATAQ
jgi:hypothetical protein